MLQIRIHNSFSRLLRRVGISFLLITIASTAFGWTDCGTNIQYEIDGSGVLRFRSPDPEQSATIVSMAFKNNKEIKSVTLPENVTTIEGQAFMGCTALTDIDLGNVQYISSYAFDGCTALTQVVIPPTVTNIHEHAFYGCSSLVSVICRPQKAPTLVTDPFTNCASDLQICVPAIGAYSSKSIWSIYHSNGKLSLCFLDENDDQATTEYKISVFRDTDHRTDIDIFRTLRKAGCFNTLTLPFNVPNITTSPLVGAEVYEFAGAAVSDGTLQLDITPLAGNTLYAGTPYLIQWDNTGEVLNRMHFTGITWDTDQTAADAGTGDVTMHGFYGKTHISDDTQGGQHLNLFLGGGNELYWPTDGGDESAMMLGFRAWFRINGSSVSGAPVHRGMPAMLRIVATPTAIETTQDPSSLNGGERGRLVLSNGQLVIIRNGQTFSLTGQRL